MLQWHLHDDGRLLLGRGHGLWQRVLRSKPRVLGYDADVRDGL
jgi:hypothetical protein